MSISMANTEQTQYVGKKKPSKSMKKPNAPKPKKGKKK